MLRIAAIVLCCGCSTDICAQMLLGRLQKFQKFIPPGNYSGITPIGDNRYAIVSDKDNTEGFTLPDFSGQPRKKAKKKSEPEPEKEGMEHEEV